jgi:hypothetical protein
MKYTKEIIALMLQSKDPIESITEFIDEKVEETRKHQMLFWLTVLMVVVLVFVGLSVNQHLAAERYKAEHPVSVNYQDEIKSSSVEIDNGNGNSVNVQQ